MPLGFLGTSFVLGVVVVLCPCMCRTVANFVSFSIAQLARASVLLDLLVLVLLMFVLGRLLVLILLCRYR